jgi:CubicO group peptidase (beta-lactamase class C family)
MQQLFKNVILVTCLLTINHFGFSQLYFPPKDVTLPWKTIAPAELNFCQNNIDSFYTYLEEQESKGFMLLKDGKIVLEKYFGTFTKDSLWYWASAGKTLTAFLVGKAQEEQLLSIQESSSNYLGLGWSNCTQEQESKIKILHHLTMTTGLNDEIPDNHCTLKSCLSYTADPGTRWAYHNAPYTLLESIITNATKKTFDNYTNSKIGTIIGMKGKWFKSDYDNVYFSNLRSMARFGLLIQNNGIWDSDTLLQDTNYLKNMINSSQSINPSYGYLWWLNGKSSYMLPTSQIVIPGGYAPDAPSDVISAIGKNGQLISLSKSNGLLFVRMGKQKNSGEVSTQFANSIWKKINSLVCKTNTLNDNDLESVQIYPNPVNDILHIQHSHSNFKLKLSDISGKIIMEYKYVNQIDISNLEKGIYLLELENEGNLKSIRAIKN